MTLTPLGILLLLLTGAGLQFLAMIAPVRKPDLWWALVVILISGMFAAFLHYRDDIPWEASSLMAGGLMLILAITFSRDRILPRLEEGNVLVWTALLLIALYYVAGIQSTLTIAAAVGALGITVTLLRPHRMGFAMKLTIYAWCLLAIAVFTSLQIRWGSLTRPVEDWSGRVSPWIAVIDGMAVMYCAAHAVWLWRLIPIPGRSQTISSRLQELREDTAAMVKRLSDAQIHPSLGAAVLALVLGVAAFNEVLQLVDPWLLMRCMLIGIPAVAWILHWFNNHWRPRPAHTAIAKAPARGSARRGPEAPPQEAAIIKSGAVAAWVRHRHPLHQRRSLGRPLRPAESVMTLEAFYPS